MDGQRIEDERVRRLVAVAAELLEDVKERRRGRGLVAVHLRPEQHALRARPQRQHLDGPPLEGAAHLLERQPAGVLALEGQQALAQLQVLEAGRSGRDEALARPGRVERGGVDRRRGGGGGGHGDRTAGAAGSGLAGSAGGP